MHDSIFEKHFDQIVTCATPKETFHPGPKQLERLQKWVDDLRSGKFNQANGVLYGLNDDDKIDSFCCLGLASANVVGAIPERLEEIRERFCEMPDPDWFRYQYGLPAAMQAVLADANDGAAYLPGGGEEKLSFSQLAKVIIAVVNRNLGREALQ